MASVDHLLSRVEGALAAVGSLRGQIQRIDDLGERLVGVLADGGTIYTAGNGGSAAQALHLAEELIGRYRGNRPPLRAICLNADPTALTCIANDYGYESVFARQAEALVRPGDALVVLSTSGRSPNVLKALDAARRSGATTVGLLGGDGAAAAAVCDLALIVPSSDSAHVQEAHQVVIHLICEVVEREFAE